MNRIIYKAILATLIALNIFFIVITLANYKEAFKTLENSLKVLCTLISLLALTSFTLNLK